ncbi:hypothetical protein FOI68_21390 [Brevibacillus sp. LEMMJ03]|uniref:hypothetical protein n=1 Tax=Brevibacillus sp. LEMMJ03 TaxID=2595056 RepID=UPI0011800960|nr:hypothetical protein [Brevibacillus sp. LEMMJ03]TRY23341.1 hypothetical protein FOI68_21390 [Brevibacillus sp. LEMMJ03]
MVLVSLSVACYSLLYILTYLILQRLKVEVETLPKSTIRKRVASSPIGLNIKSIVHYPEIEKNNFTIFMFASPSCASCHGELEDYLSNRPGIPFVCLVENSIPTLTTEFINIYQDLFPIIPVSYEDMRKLNIHTNPSFIIINSQGKIERVVYIAEGIRTWYRDLIHLSNENKAYSV